MSTKVKLIRQISREEEMRYWVIKGNPRANEWDEMLIPGKVDRWHTGRAPKDWAQGDRLFCWESSPALRMIGLARINKTDCGIDDNGDLLFKVEYETTRFQAMPTIDHLRQIPILNTASFLKTGPATTVFPLSTEQADILIRLLVTMNPGIASVWSDLQLTAAAAIVPDVDVSPGVNEGGAKWVAHLVRERNRTIVEQKKAKVFEATGALKCEVCRFDFFVVFGSVGESFCEVHHRLPLSQVDGTVETRLEDLAIVCSNCHRMLHRRALTISVDELKVIIEERAKKALHTPRNDGRA